MVLVEQRLARVLRLPIDNEPDVEARPADVGREHVRVTEHLPEVSRADHSARRTGRQEVRGALARVVGRRHAAVRQHDHELVFEPRLAQAVRERRDVPVDLLGEVGVDDRGGRPLVLAEDRGDLA